MANPLHIFGTIIRNCVHYFELQYAGRKNIPSSSMHLGRHIDPAFKLWTV